MKTPIRLIWPNNYHQLYCVENKRDLMIWVWTYLLWRIKLRVRWRKGRTYIHRKDGYWQKCMTWWAFSRNMGCLRGKEQDYVFSIYTQIIWSCTGMQWQNGYNKQLLQEIHSYDLKNLSLNRMHSQSLGYRHGFVVNIGG